MGINILHRLLCAILQVDGTMAHCPVSSLSLNLNLKQVSPVTVHMFYEIMSREVTAGGKHEFRR